MGTDESMHCTVHWLTKIRFHFITKHCSGLLLCAVLKDHDLYKVPLVKFFNSVKLSAFLPLCIGTVKFVCVLQEGYWELTTELGELINVDLDAFAVFLKNKGINSLGENSEPISGFQSKSNLHHILFHLIVNLN